MKNRSRFFASLLVLVMMLLAVAVILPAAAADADAWDGETLSDFPGSGTDADPFVITDGAQLANMRMLVNTGAKFTDALSYAEASYVLGADIYLNEIFEDAGLWEELGAANKWEPIGNEASPFSGRFDGAGYTIHGLYFKKTTIEFDDGDKGTQLSAGNYRYIGLFGYISGAEVRDFTLSDGYLFNPLDVGSAVGGATNSVISGITNNIPVVASKAFCYHGTIQPFAGGIVGELIENCVVSDCVNNAPVVGDNGSNSSGSGTLDVYSGGIVGRSLAGSATVSNRIINCFNYADVKASVKHDYRTSRAGGIVAEAKFTDILGCVNTGKVTDLSPGNNSAGGIIGNATSSVNIFSCINMGNVESGKSNRNNGYAGGIVGNAGGSTTVKNCVIGGTVTGVTENKTGVIAGQGNSSSAKFCFVYYIASDTYPLFGNTPKLSSENYAITAEHMTGAASSVIAADGTYANTASLVTALNAAVAGENIPGATFTQGETYPEVYDTYVERFALTANSTTNGNIEVLADLSQFPAGFTAPSALLSTVPAGSTARFKVIPNSGYVIRSIGIAYGDTPEEIIFPDNESVYSFTMPAEPVTVNLYLVPVGADVYSVTYEDVDGVTAWSAYRYEAHFKGYDTPIPNPTRPGYVFQGWQVNGVGCTKDLVLAGDAYSANITLTAVWVAKNDVVLDTSTQSFVYDGNAKVFTLSGAGAALDGITVTYFVNGEWTAEAPIIAGAYDVRITRAEDPDYKPLDSVLAGALFIDRAASSITINTDLSKVYNNTEVYSPAVTTVGDGTVSFTYYKDGSLLSYVPKDAGTYTVRATISQGTNYKEQYAEATFTISKATLSLDDIRWNYDTSYTYDTTEHSVSIVGAPSDVVITYTGTTAATAAGTYTAGATFTVDSNNYAPFTIDELTWTIDKAVVDSYVISWSDSVFVYDGTEKSVTVVGLPSDITIASITGNKAIGAGSYTAHVTFSFDSDNYSSVELADLSWTIERANYEVDGMHWTASEFTYDGAAHTVVLEGVPAGITVSYTGNRYVGAGTYVASAVFSGDANHNPISTMTLTWTIAKAKTVFEYSDKFYFDYDGTEKHPSVDINHTYAVPSYSLTGMISCGSYSVTVTVPATDNYEAAITLITVIIKPADSDLAANANVFIDVIEQTTSMQAARIGLIRTYELIRLMGDTDSIVYQEIAARYIAAVATYNKQVQARGQVVDHAVIGTMSQIYELMPKGSIKAAVDELLAGFAADGSGTNEGAVIPNSGETHDKAAELNYFERFVAKLAASKPANAQGSIIYTIGGDTLTSSFSINALGALEYSVQKFVGLYIGDSSEEYIRTVTGKVNASDTAAVTLAALDLKAEYMYDYYTTINPDGTAVLTMVVNNANITDVMGNTIQASGMTLTFSFSASGRVTSAVMEYYTPAGGQVKATITYGY